MTVVQIKIRAMLACLCLRGDTALVYQVEKARHPPFTRTIAEQMNNQRFANTRVDWNWC